MLDWRLKAYRRWMRMDVPTWAHVHYPPIDFQEISYYSAPKQNKDGPKVARRRGPEAARDLRQARHPAARARAPRRRRGGRRVRQRLGRDHVQGAPRRGRRHLLPVLGGGAQAPRAREKYLGTVVPVGDNFYAALNSAVFTDGSFVFVPKGVRCPMELSTYFRINASKTGQFERTLIIAEEGVARQLPRRLHRADARRKPAACRGRRARLRSMTPRSSTRRCRTGIRATRTASAASTTSSPSAATAAAATRRSPGPRSRRAPRSPGNTRAASCAATARRASSTRSRSRTTTSRPTPAPR